MHFEQLISLLKQHNINTDHITNIADVSEEQITQRNNQKISLKITVYRGQQLNQNEFRRLISNCGGLISINSFMSTTTNKELASRYAGDWSLRPMLESRLFEIEAYSQFPEEEEVLFTMGAVFRIKSIEEQNKVWHVKLMRDVLNKTPAAELCDDILHKVLIMPSPMLAFSQILSIIHPPRVVIRYLKRIEREFLTDNELLYYIYHTLALIYTNTADSEKAIKYLQKQTCLLQEALPLNYTALGLLYLNEGLLFIHYGLLGQAEFSLQQALNKIALSGETHDEYLCEIYAQLGTIHLLVNELDDAVFYFKKMLASELNFSLWSSVSYAKGYLLMGTVFWTLQDYSSALEYHLEANEIYRHILPSDHFVYMTILYATGVLHVENDNQNDALEYFNKYNNIQHHYCSFVQDLSLAMLNTIVAIQKYRQQEWIIAMEYLEKAVEIQEKLTPFRFSLALTYRVMACIHQNFNNDNNMALLYHEKSLDILNKLAI